MLKFVIKCVDRILKNDIVLNFESLIYLFQPIFLVFEAGRKLVRELSRGHDKKTDSVHGADETGTGLLLEICDVLFEPVLT